MRKGFFSLIFKNVRARPLRTVLTTVGIIIGVVTIVLLLSLGQGMRNAITGVFSSIGSDMIVVQAATPGFGPPGQDSTRPLTEKDVDVLRGISEVRRIGGRLLRSVLLETKEQTRSVFVASLPVDSSSRKLIEEANAMELVLGNDLKASDSGKVLIGSFLWKSPILLRDVAVGKRISLNGREFTVVGHLAPAGGPRDSVIVMNEDDVRELVQDEKTYSMIAVEIVDSVSPKSASDTIAKTLRNERGVKEGFEDFTVTTSEELFASVNSILTAVQAVFIAIASISIIVGSIGMMNTMYTAVLERTREIGILSSLGASKGDILRLYILESALVGIVGGSIGIVGGVLIGMLAGKGMMSAGINVSPSLSWTAILGILALSGILGAIAGFLPAREASSLNPVEALSR